jgi:transcriptional regulator with XRE-family HTH domain
MELVHPLEPNGEESPLARARLHRKLTVEETARRAGITAEEVRWLEEGRVYRFPRPDDALIATALYATALGLVAPWLKPGPEIRGCAVVRPAPTTVACRELKKR